MAQPPCSNRTYIDVTAPYEYEKQAQASLDLPNSQVSILRGSDGSYGPQLGSVDSSNLLAHFFISAYRPPDRVSSRTLLMFFHIIGFAANVAILAIRKS